MQSDSCHNALPLVSIIIPSADSHRTIRAAIDSVLSQTYPCIEIIVVLNGNYGKTHELIRDYKGITILTLDKPNAYMARQHGAELSKGEYIMFLDADDMLHKGAITEAVKTITRHAADILQLKLIQFTTKCHVTLRWKFPCRYDSSDALRGILSDASLYNPAMIAKLYRRQVLMPFPSIDYSGFWGEDRLCNMHIFGRNPITVYEPSAIYYYRYGGASRDMTRQALQEEIREVHTLKIEYLRRHGLHQYLPDVEKEYACLCAILKRYQHPSLLLKFKMYISKLLS